VLTLDLISRVGEIGELSDETAVRGDGGGAVDRDWRLLPRRVVPSLRASALSARLRGFAGLTWVPGLSVIALSDCGSRLAGRIGVARG
jgi:hypothetical protein